MIYIINTVQYDYDMCATYDANGTQLLMGKSCEIEKLYISRLSHTSSVGSDVTGKMASNGNVIN